MKVVLIAALLCAALAPAIAQSAPRNTGASKPATTAKKAPSAAGRTECVAAVGLCVTIPATWQRLGNIFDDLGFVVAEQHVGVDSASWPQISVAAIDVPTQKGGGAPSLDALIDIVLTPDGSFTTSETQQRTRLLLNGANAEILRVKLHNDVAKDASQADTIEEVALIEGDDGLVYSIALRCAPGELARLEPIFQKTARSWRVKPPATPAKPTQDSNKK
jgi:hypothetical protein